MLRSTAAHRSPLLIIDIICVYVYIYIFFFVIFCHLTFDSRLMASNSVDCWLRKF